MQTRAFKIKYNGEFRRLQLQVSDATALFADIWARANDIANGYPFVLQYQDKEGDMITIDHSEEIPDLLAEFGTKAVVLHIVESQAPSAQQQTHQNTQRASHRDSPIANQPPETKSEQPLTASTSNSSILIDLFSRDPTEHAVPHPPRVTETPTETLVQSSTGTNNVRTTTTTTTTTTTACFAKLDSSSNPFSVLSFLFGVLSPAYQSSLSESSRKVLPTLCAALAAAVMTEGSSYCGYDLRQLCGLLKAHSDCLLGILRDPIITDAMSLLVADFGTACDSASGLHQLIGHVVSLVSEHQHTLQLPESLVAGLEISKSVAWTLSQSAMMSASVMTSASSQLVGHRLCAQHDSDTDSDADEYATTTHRPRVPNDHNDDDDDDSAVPLLADTDRSNNSITLTTSCHMFPLPSSTVLHSHRYSSWTHHSDDDNDNDDDDANDSNVQLNSLDNNNTAFLPRSLVADDSVPAVPALTVLGSHIVSASYDSASVAVPSWRVRNCGGQACSQIMLAALDGNPFSVALGPNNALQLSQGTGLQPGQETTISFRIAVPTIPCPSSVVRARFLPYDRADETILCEPLEVEIHIQSQDAEVVALHQLRDMGFTDAERNRFLLRRSNNDTAAVVQTLLGQLSL